MNIREISTKAIKNIILGVIFAPIIGMATYYYVPQIYDLANSVWTGTLPITRGGTGTTTSTGTTNTVLSNGPTLVAPVLGSASGTALTLSNAMTFNPGNPGTSSTAYIGGNGSGRLLLNVATGNEVDFSVNGVGYLYFTSSTLGVQQSTASTSSSTGALIVTGGAGIGGNIFAAGTGTMPLYNNSGTAQNAPHAVTGTCTLSAGSCTVTLSGSAVYASTNSYVCNGTDPGGSALAVSSQNQSASSVKFFGTVSDTVNFICTGT